MTGRRGPFDGKAVITGAGKSQAAAAWAEPGWS